MSELWERIRAARASAGMTQEELASRIGVRRPTVGVWETSDPTKRSQPRDRMLRKIADATGAPYGWLISDKSEIDADFISQNPDFKNDSLDSRLITQKKNNRRDLERALLELHSLLIQDKISFDDAEIIIAVANAIRGRIKHD
ncbi:helix-turn-helix transcriptional regulator [Zooshikella marina]|uniref:helix-turn-helix transcriptional regulator n=1 Tax=Zooshikella ganghwensis TaxID=202772 RepID=UPI001BB082F4|nr:helix-turn-helix transcriptional regulator [Zooshikella ganghwensis]MBU2708951.1 helix-turn-helix transcriptional regulator [Zooshikella ganghwensis]